MDGSPTSRKQWFDLLSTHAAIAVAGTLGAFTALRVAGVSRFDPTTARAILEYAGTANIVVSSALSLLSFVLGPVLFGELLSRAIRDGDARSWIRFVICAAYVALVVPLFIIVGLAIVVVFFWVIRRRGHIDQSAESTPQQFPYLLFYDRWVLVIILIGWALSSEMWLPSERIETATGPVTGFVLGESTGWTAVLQSDDRVVLQVSTDSIDDRSICRPGGSRRLTATLLELAGQSPSYPACD